MVEKSQETENAGEILRNARLKNGKTLGDVSKDLCIRKVYLEAIENLDFETLPPVPYGIGFMRSYSEYLGLDKTLITALYKQAFQPEAESEKETAGKNTDLADDNTPGFGHILVGLLGLIVAIGAWKAYEMYQNRMNINAEKEMVESAVVPEPLLIEETENEPAQLEEMGIDDIPVIETEISEETETTQLSSSKAMKQNTTPIKNMSDFDKESKKVKEDIPLKKSEALTTENKKADSRKQKAEENMPASADKQPENVTPTTVRLVLVGPSWVEVRHGDNILINGNYSKGFSYDIPDKEGMIVSVGRYRNVDFYINGHLTKVATAMKQTNIKLDKYIKKN